MLTIYEILGLFGSNAAPINNQVSAVETPDSRIFRLGSSDLTLRTFEFGA